MILVLLSVPEVLLDDLNNGIPDGFFRGAPGAKPRVHCPSGLKVDTGVQCLELCD